MLDDNYTLIMLDLGSTSPEIKLSALDKIKSLTDKKRFIPVLKKLSKNKNESVSNNAKSILDSIGYKDNQSLLGSINICEFVKEELKGFINDVDFEFFEPYISDDPSKFSEHINLPSDVKEFIQKYLNSPDPFVRIKTIFPLLLVPAEYKYKVNLLVDLLRDKSPIVVAYTIKFLNYMDCELVKKVIPIIVTKFADKDPFVRQELKQSVLNMHPKLFIEDFEAIDKEGLTLKIQKSITNKLTKLLKENNLSSIKTT